MYHGVIHLKDSFTKAKNFWCEIVPVSSSKGIMEMILYMNSAYFNAGEKYL